MSEKNAHTLGRDVSSSPSGDARRPPGPESASLWRRVAAGLREIVTVAAIALVISFLIKTFLMQAFWIPSGSMESTLIYGDRVVVSKIQAGPMKVERGDIVVFEDPDNWLPPVVRNDRGPVLNTMVRGLEFVGLAPTGQGNHLIKRVIGLSGDHVVCCDDEGRMSVNDQPLNEDYLFEGDEPSTIPFDITVPEGNIWVMGDHRSISGDSRVHDDGTGATGSVPSERVVGQAMALVWPISRADWFERPQTLRAVDD